MGTKLNETAAFDPASVDLHDAVCCEFKDIGVNPGPYGEKHQGILVFQVEEEVEEGDFAGQRKEVRLYFNMTWGSSGNPSKIRTTVNKWRGKDMTPEALADFELETLEGMPCRLDVSHKTSASTGRTYAVIDNVLKPGKTKLKPKDYVRLDDRQGAKSSEATGEEGGAETGDDPPF